MFSKSKSLILAAAAGVAMLAASLLTAAPAAAAPGIAADLQVSLSGSYAGTNALGTPILPLQFVGLNRFTPGVGSKQADKLFTDTRTLAASATENLDLAGVLPDPLSGTALTFAKVKFIMITAAVTNTNNVCIGGAASNAFLGPFSDATDIVCIKPGGFYAISAPVVGWTVTASTGDLLKVANSSGTTGVTYSVAIGGTSS